MKKKSLDKTIKVYNWIRYSYESVLLRLHVQIVCVKRDRKRGRWPRNNDSLVIMTMQITQILTSKCYLPLKKLYFLGKISGSRIVTRKYMINQVP
jgi:hypothetical protein